MRCLHSVDGMDLEVGEDAGNPFAVAPASKQSNEPPGELTPIALPRLLQNDGVCITLCYIRLQCRACNITDRHRANPHYPRTGSWRSS